MEPLVVVLISAFVILAIIAIVGIYADMLNSPLSFGAKLLWFIVFTNMPGVGFLLWMLMRDTLIQNAKKGSS